MMIQSLYKQVFGLMVGLLLSPILWAQVEPDERVPYYSGFEFVEGIYMSYEEFYNNSPSIQLDFESRGGQLFLYNAEAGEMQMVNPDSVWGYSQGVNVYISYSGAFWRLINIGSICQFSAIVVNYYRDFDAFGFPVNRATKSLEQLYLEHGQGGVFLLNEENVEPILQKDALIWQQYRKKRKGKKIERLILAIKAYNERYPAYFPQP